MYECQDCGRRFERAEEYFEKHGLDTPPFERRWCCPICGSENFRECVGCYCRGCGRRLAPGAGSYCSEHCRRQDYLLRQQEAERRASRRNDPIEKLVRATWQYNLEHGTRYSYGQYVAMREAGAIRS